MVVVVVVGRAGGVRGQPGEAAVEGGADDVVAGGVHVEGGEPLEAADERLDHGLRAREGG